LQDVAVIRTQQAEQLQALLVHL